MDQLKELETLAASPVTLEVAGEVIEVRPLPVGRLPPFIRAVRPFLAVLDVEEGGSIDLVALVADHGESVIEAVAVATGRPRGWLEELGADEFLRLAGAVLEVNADFFARRLLPTFSEVLGRVIGLGAGQTPSSA